MKPLSKSFAEKRVDEARAVIGQRMESLRIRQNKQQQEVWESSNASKATYHRLATGTGNPSFNHFLAVAYELGVLDAIVEAFPEHQISPIQTLENRGQVRQRVKSKIGLLNDRLVGKGEVDSEW